MNIGLIIIGFFSLVVFIHELGHFVAARFFKIKVLEFAIGMGPAIFKKKIKDVVYSLRIIPIGGFCSLKGEEGENNDPDSFNKKPWYQRIIVLGAGGFMNVILGFLMCILMLFQRGFIVTNVVESVNTNASASAFLKKGDKILKINKRKIHTIRDIEKELAINKNTFEITVLREGEVKINRCEPFIYEIGDSKVATVGFVPAKVKVNFFNSIIESYHTIVWMIKMVFESIGVLITGKAQFKEMSGIVGVAAMVGKAVRSGLSDLLFLCSFVSINIGLFNLLPFPALDGGGIIFVLLELIRKKPMKAEYEGAVRFIGFALLIALSIFATWNDILRFLR